MNERFFLLPEEKQQAIINAGYIVFSQNTYKKSPVSEIADAAGISKSLLFHYFKNKKELYLFLLQKSADITTDFLRKYKCYEKADIFEIMYSGLEAKVEIMKNYPALGNFTLKAYYEKDPAVCGDIQEITAKYTSYKLNSSLLKINPEHFKEGIDLELMFLDMYWASAGYLWEKQQNGAVDADKMKEDFKKLIDFWKQVYSR